MAQQKNSITGLTFNKDAICLAQFLPEERQVANISIQPIEGLGVDLWESAGAALKDLVKAAKLGNENVICSLPGEHAVIRKLSLDSDEPSADEALEWEFSQQVISARDEYVFDFEKLAQAPEDGQDRFLVVGYRTEAVDKLTGLLRANKLNPLVVDIDIFALINAFEANYDESTSTPTVLALSDERMCKCVLTKQGSYVDLELVRLEGEARDVGKYAAAVEDTIIKLLASNPGVPARDALPVFLSGTLFSQAEYADEVKNAIPNAEVLYPFRKINCSMGMPEDELRKYSSQLAVAVGLALRGAE